MPDYPVRLNVDYPEAPRNRVTVLFRLFLLIPIVALLALLSGGGGGSYAEDGMSVGGAGIGIVVLPALLMLLFRRKYPHWWFDWNLELTRFSARVNSYALLLRDEYPSTDEEQSVHVEIDYPDAQQLSRWLPLVKWLLAIPHWIVLVFLAIAAVLVTFIAWIVILVTGRYPRGLFDFVVGVQRWGTRVSGYALLLVTDRYPPFSLR